ncbi:MAG: hypothetical protein QOJ89_3051 [bacterium]
MVAVTARAAQSHKQRATQRIELADVFDFPLDSGVRLEQLIAEQLVPKDPCRLDLFSEG